jgi:hypothetical protein
MKMVDERGAKYEAKMLIKRVGINDNVSLMSRQNWPKRKFVILFRRKKNEELNT